MPPADLHPTPAAAETPRCAWCAAPAERPLIVGERLRCARCGVWTTHPWPTAEQLDAAYTGPYRPRTGRFSGPGDRILAFTRGRLARRIDRIAPPGPVLDVGAGDGSLLRALERSGRAARGLERGEEQLAQLEGRFAAVVLWHSLEHLPSPTAALGRAAELLEPGGLLVLALPNAASLQAVAFGDRWLALDIPRHLTHVPASALVARLQRAGLRVTRISHWRGGQVLFGWLHGLVGGLPGAPSLYDALRRPAARFAPMPAPARAYALAAAVLLAPVAAAAALIEVLLRRGGSVYVEARHD